MAFILVPVLDLALFQVTKKWMDDAHALTPTDDWKKVKTSALAGGVGKLLFVAGYMAGAVPPTMGMPIKALSAVHEIINIVLINKAQDKVFSDKAGNQFTFAIAGAVISAVAAAASKPAPVEEEPMEEMYYEEEVEGEEETAGDDSYYGYY